MPNDTYFAAEPASRLASEIVDKFETYQRYLQTSGKLDLWKKSYVAYYRSALSGGQIRSSGQQGEYSVLNVNHYKNLLKHLQTMTTSQRPNFEPRATNTDQKSQAQALLANTLLEYYLREKKLERYLKTSVEHALIFGEGFLKCDWDATGGEVYAVNPDTNSPIYNGDIKYSNILPDNVARDFTKDSALEHSWFITRSYRNKFDLSSKFSEFSSDILATPSKDAHDYVHSIARYGLYDESDDVPVYEFYHKRSEALPNGRYALVCNDICLLEGPLPYRELPVYRISGSEITGTTFGYSVGFDLLAVQEAIDTLYSTVLTNQKTFGVQNIISPKGSGIDVSELTDGLNLIEYDKNMGPPQALNLTQTPPEIFNFMQMLERLMETLSGVNSVSRGNPEASLKSGAALALVQSMAIQFSMDLQQSYAQLLEDVGTCTLSLLKDFAKVPRVAAIAGKSNRQYMREFTGDDLNLVNRVTVDMGNPLTRTTAGKVNLAEQLLQAGFVDDPQQFIMVMQTGRLEPIIEGKTSQLMLIRGENEKLSEGQEVKALVVDNHELHILEHAAVASSPEARSNPEVMAALTVHLQEHIDMYKNLDPIVAQILKMQPQSNPKAQPNSQGQFPLAQSVDATNPVTQEAATVNMPNMPQNPLNQVPIPDAGNL